MAEKIGNWSEIASKTGTGGSPANLCPNTSQIQAAGLVVNGGYGANQLPALVHVEAGWKYYLTSADGSAAYNATSGTIAFTSYKRNGAGTAVPVAVSIQGYGGIATSATPDGNSGTTYYMRATFFTNNTGNSRSATITVVQAESGKTIIGYLYQAENPAYVIHKFKIGPQSSAGESAIASMGTSVLKVCAASSVDGSDQTFVDQLRIPTSINQTVTFQWTGNKMYAGLRTFVPVLEGCTLECMDCTIVDGSKNVAPGTFIDVWIQLSSIGNDSCEIGIFGYNEG